MSEEAIQQEEEAAAPPVVPSTASWDGSDLHVAGPELSEEMGKRVVAGLLKAARAWCPTQESTDGKKEHVTVPVIDGSMYVSTAYAPYAAKVTLDLAELCKKKSPLRQHLAAAQASLRTGINYSDVSVWLKANEKNLRSVRLGRGGIRLTVVPGMSELSLPASYAIEAEGVRVRDRIAEVCDPSRLLGEAEAAIPMTPDGKAYSVPGAMGGVLAIALTGNGVEFMPNLRTSGEDFAPLAQVRLKQSQLLGSTVVVRAYSGDVEENCVITLEMKKDAVSILQAYRVLKI